MDQSLSNLSALGCFPNGMKDIKLLVFAPSHTAPSETFVRANIKGMPFRTKAYFGDQLDICKPHQFIYSLSIILSKALFRIGLRSLGSLPSSFVAWTLCLRFRPDVILAEFGFHAVRIMYASQLSGIPLVVQFHGADATSQKYTSPLKHCYQRLFQISSGLVVKSTPMKFALISLGAKSCQILVSPCGGDQYLFRNSFPSNSRPHFISVGRFVEKKGPLLTIRAFALALDSVRDDIANEMSLTMFGDGPLFNDAQNLVFKLGLDSKIRLLGCAQPEIIADEMRRSRGFLQHSIVGSDGDSEGSPVAVVEAQLSGLPVVATRHAGIPDVVLHLETGILVDEGDISGMAEAIKRLSVSPQLAGSLGAEASLRSRSFFTIEHHIYDLSILIYNTAHSNW